MQDAQQIADPVSGDIVSSVIDVNQTMVLAKAATSVLKTVGQTIGSLLDTFA